MSKYTGDMALITTLESTGAAGLSASSQTATHTYKEESK